MTTVPPAAAVRVRFFDGQTAQAHPATLSPEPGGVRVDLPDGRTGIKTGLTVPLNPNVASYTFWVRREVAGQPATLPLIVTDACGDWPTFVGGGASAGF